MNKKIVRNAIFFTLLAVLLGLCVGASAECGDGVHTGPFTYLITKEPTCTESGSRQKICSTCGADVGTETITPTGHQLQSRTTIFTPSTCTESGRQQVTKQCVICGYVYSVTNETIPPLGHQLKNRTTVLTPSTCTESGQQQVAKQCIICGYVDSVTNDTIPALGHNFGSTVMVQLPTCTEDGAQRQYCTQCSYFEEQSVAALGHIWGDSVTTPATCASTGSVQQICRRDASHTQITDILPIDPDAHQWGEGVITKAPTATESGIRTFTCMLNSAHTKTEVVPAELTAVNGVITGYSGSDASLVIPSEINGQAITGIGDFAFAGKSFLTNVTIPASVTSIGQDAFDGCDQLIITGIIDSCANAYANENNIPFVVLPACNHEWGKPTATLSPTKTEKGSAERFCLICGEKDVMEIHALNDMNTLYLPAGLTAIEDEAFSLLTADAIILPNGCTSIGENAFAGSCIIYIRVPAGVTIPETAFDGCFGHLVVDTGE